jgi:hypothetical protein
MLRFSVLNDLHRIDFYHALKYDRKHFNQIVMILPEFSERGYIPVGAGKREMQKTLPAVGVANRGYWRNPAFSKLFNRSYEAEFFKRQLRRPNTKQ